MQRVLVASLLTFFYVIASAGPQGISDRILKEKCSGLDSSGACALYDVSLIDLIANPEAFHGKRVRLIGFVRLEFEGNAIYLSKESYKAGITKNALWLNPPANTSLAKKGAAWGPDYAIVEGRFDALNHGHMGLFSGAITDTTRLDLWRLRP